MRGRGGTVYRGPFSLGYFGSQTGYDEWISEAIDSFVPEGLSEHDQTVVMPIIRRWAHADEQQTADLTTQMMSALARYVMWTIPEPIAATDEALLDPRNIERWIALGTSDLSKGARGNYRSQLRRVSRVVLGKDPGPTRQRLQAADVAPPYVARELAALDRWARSRSTLAAIENCMLLLAFSLGMGWNTEDLIVARGRDLYVCGDGTVVGRVTGRRPREVVCRPKWEAVLAEAKVRVADADLLYRPGRTSINPNQVTNYLYDVGHPSDGFYMSTQRARVTWIVHHLNSGTPVKTLLLASGIKSIQGLARYEQFITEPDQAARFASLRRAA